MQSVIENALFLISSKNLSVYSAYPTYICVKNDHKISHYTQVYRVISLLERLTEYNNLSCRMHRFISYNIGWNKIKWLNIDQKKDYRYYFKKKNMQANSEP